MRISDWSSDVCSSDLFMEPGGFGDALGNDVSQLRRTIAPLAALLAAGRAAGMLIMHTREGHKPDLSDLHETKKTRGRGAMRSEERRVGKEGVRTCRSRG